MNTPEFSAFRHVLSRHTSFEMLICFFAISLISSQAFLSELDGSAGIKTEIAPLLIVFFGSIAWITRKKNKMKLGTVSMFLDGKTKMTDKTLDECLKIQNRADKSHYKNTLYRLIIVGMVVLIGLLASLNGYEETALFADVGIALLILALHDLFTCKIIATRTHDALKSIHAIKSPKQD
jgi:hypothetical protein